MISTNTISILPSAIIRIDIRATYAKYKFYLPVIKLTEDMKFWIFSGAYARIVLYEHNMPFSTNSECSPCDKCALFIQFPAGCLFVLESALDKGLWIFDKSCVNNTILRSYFQNFMKKDIFSLFFFFSLDYMSELLLRLPSSCHIYTTACLHNFLLLNFIIPVNVQHYLIWIKNSNTNSKIQVNS